MGKKVRANNTRLVEGGQGDNPKLMAQMLSDGRESLYLEYYRGYKEAVSANGNAYKKAIRETERLSLFLWVAPRTPIERQQNKETVELAKRIRFERGQELLEQGEGYRLKKDSKIDFIAFFQSYLDKYNKKDIRMIGIALQRFKDFLRDTDEYNVYRSGIRAEQLNKDMIGAFVEYLQSRSKGEGAKSIFQRFKKVVARAVELDYIKKNPYTGVSIKVDDKVLTKDVLSLDEIKKLISTHYAGENTEIRRAFIFCLYTGVRFCDVKDLTFANVDYSNKLLKFEQNKTKGHSASSGVVIPLNDGLISLIGDEVRAKDDLIFNLPTYETCLHAVKRWVARAGINKHISWHCARHSFAVNILNNGANIKTVASLLGHAGLKHTEKYTRAVDKLKEDAINSLPMLEI